MYNILQSLRVSPLLTATIIDILLKSEYNRDGKLSVTDDQLAKILTPCNLTPSTVIRLLTSNQFSVTNIHTRTKTGRSDGHHYIIDLNTRQDKPIIYKISKTRFPLISSSLQSSTEGANV